MTRPPLTAKQRAVLLYLVTFWGANQRFPTVRQIGAEFSIDSPNGVMGHLRALQKKAYVRLPATKGDARALTVVGLDAAGAAAKYLAGYRDQVRAESQPTGEAKS